MRNPLRGRAVLAVMSLALSLLGIVPLLAPAAQPRNNASSSSLHAAFESRRDAALKALDGAPFRPARKSPPLAPGRPPFVRGWAWSVTDFAMKSLLLNEQLDAANAALLDYCRYFTDNPAVRDDKDNFYWSMDVLCRMLEFYGSAGSRAPGRLRPATEAAALEMMWRWVKSHSRLADADTQQSQTWFVEESENHHVMGFSTAWHFSKFLMNSPSYRDRPYDDGAPAARHFAAWTAYAKAYLRERASKSLFVEVASSEYNFMALKGVYNFYDFAPDPELRRRAGRLLDLYWACWAEEQLGGVRGGGKTRIYPGPGSLRGLTDEFSRLAWFYLGVGPAVPAPHGALFTPLTSAWRMPPLVAELALDPAGRGCYEIRQWPLGLAVKGFNTPPDYHLRTDAGGILRYSYCTPEFILGTLMTEARPHEDWTMISDQNRWQGGIFAGHPDARIVPQVRALKSSRAYNQHWSVQCRGTLITQKLRTSAGAGEMRVWFSEAGLGAPVERGGWFFVEAPGAYAAVRPAAGGFAWQNDEREKAGKWLVPRDPWTPVILEVARKADFKDFEAFQEKLMKNAIKFENGILEYRSLAGDAFVFDARARQAPRINGAEIDYSPKASFASPFIQSARDSGVVTIQYGGKRLVLDFNRE